MRSSHALVALGAVTLALGGLGCDGSGDGSDSAPAPSPAPSPAPPPSTDPPVGPRSCGVGSPGELDGPTCAWLSSLRYSNELPPALGNRYAEQLDAAELGMNLFYDARFSTSGDVRCATCHDPEYAFTARRAVTLGVTTARDAPTLLGAMGSRWLFWDGRADSGWSQSLVPFENEHEVGSNRLRVAHRIALSYRASYEAIFGALPALDDPLRFPAEGKPGSAAWAAMAEADRAAVNLVFVNAGKAIEAFERRVVSGPSRFDDFLLGDASALGDEAKAGALTFRSAGCPGCHAGPRFTDGAFHSLGLPDADASSSLGREQGIALLLASEFNASSPYFDGPKPSDFPPASSPRDRGAFRTPSLRNVGATAPYGHDGRFAKLEDVVRFHLDGGGRGRPDLVGEVDPLLVRRALTDAEVAGLVAFLRTLTGGAPPVPWNTWPSR